ncbi:MAG: hypothetical protein ACREDT_05350 [Methylocella sp.]
MKQKTENQFARFIETASKLGCDEDKKRFEKSLGKIAAYKPPKKPIAKKAGQKSARRGGSAGASGGEA